MIRTTLSVLMLCAFAVLYGCNSRDNNGPEQDIKQEIARLKKLSKEKHYGFDVHLTSVYNPEMGFINRKDRLFQDMKFEPRIDNYGVYYAAFFYNYGGDVKLFNGFVNDRYVPLGRIKYMRHVTDMHSLWMKQYMEDERYGSYAITDWQIGNNLIQDVLLTPMAYHAYRTRSGDQNMIFVQFQAGDKYMNVIFCGGDFERIMVEQSPERIDNNNLMDAGTSGHGQYWHSIN